LNINNMWNKVIYRIKKKSKVNQWGEKKNYFTEGQNENLKNFRGREWVFRGAWRSRQTITRYCISFLDNWFLHPINFFLHPVNVRKILKYASPFHHNPTPIVTSLQLLSPYNIEMSKRIIQSYSTHYELMI